MNGTQNLNLETKTLEQCLRTVFHFGSNEIHNICTGQVDILTWGGLDWFGMILVMILGILFVLMFLGFVMNILSGY